VNHYLVPAEVKRMAFLDHIISEVSSGPNGSRNSRRQDVKQGEKFTAENVPSIRSGYGLHTRHLSEVVGKSAARDVERGTPLSRDLVRRS
jgi:sialic acid synthase SpsE